VVSIPVMGLLSLLLIQRGANIGVKSLYIVVGLLGLSLIFFLQVHPILFPHPISPLGSTEFRNMDGFFTDQLLS
ncbi:MAG: hypothetical protein JXA23_07020, partial [Bacteroidales bacterium]|nr:hypothetical protein [Bacteroidales bacterium]